VAPRPGTACPRCYILRPILAHLCDRRTAMGKMSDWRQRRPRCQRSSTYYRIITYITYAAYISVTGCARARKEATVAASTRAIPRCREARASGSGWPPALRSAPLGLLARRVPYSGRSVAFGIAGLGRAGRNGVGRGGVDPVGTGVAEVPGAVIDDLDKGNILGHSGLWSDGRSHAMDYRYVRAFPTL
jgi:hypothetical protein